MTSEDYKNMLFPIERITGTSICNNICDLFPELKKYPEYKERLIAKLDEGKVFKYISLVYDKNSPLFAIEDVAKRKTEACIECEFDKKKNGDISPEYMDVLTGCDSTVYKWLFRYLRLQHNAKFSKMVVFEEEYYKELSLLNGTTEPDDRKKIIFNINTMEQELDKLHREFLIGDIHNQRLMDELYRQIRHEQLKETPEDYANLIHDGRLNEKLKRVNPYVDRRTSENRIRDDKSTYSSDDDVL